MSGISILRRLLMKQAMKESAPFQHEGIMSISRSLSGNVDRKVKKWVESAKKQGQDIDKMSEQELKYLIELNKPKEPKVYSNEEAYEILRRFANKNRRGEVIKADFGKPFAEEGVTVERVVIDIKKLEPIEAMKEANKVLKGEGRYKNLSKADREKIVGDESVTDHIFEREIKPDPEDFAQGGRTGLSYLLAEDTNERVPLAGGKKPLLQLLDEDWDEDTREHMELIRKLLLAGEIPQYAGGGRVPFSMGRRAFLKLLGGVGAGIGALKAGAFSIFGKGAGKKVAKDLTQVPIGNPPGMPSWFKPLVNRVIKEGEQLKVTERERVITHKSQLPESKTDIYVNQDLSTGDVWVDIGASKHGFPDGKHGQPVRLEYKASEEIPLKEGKGSVRTTDEFNVEEAEFTGGHPENVKFEETSISEFGDHASDFTEVEKFATGKNTIKGQIGGKTKIKADDFASGGLAKMLGE